jgi:hypothetical protein
MELYVAVKIVGLYILVASCETLNGIARTVYLNKRLGVLTAKRVSMLPALLLCLAACYFYVPVTGVTSDTGLVLLGVSLALFMLMFDIVLGRFVAKVAWAVILDDLNIFKGNLLGLGMVVMSFCPLLSSKIPHSLF